jgi:hypothetical protein
MDDDSLDAFRETVADFARREIAPHAAAVDEKNSFPDAPVDLWRSLGESFFPGGLCRRQPSFLLPSSSSSLPVQNPN